jgi:hypothetical protein
MRRITLSIVPIAVASMLAAGTTITFTETANAARHGQGRGGHSSGQEPVDLGSASSFAVLTKSGVTDVPASVITGNVGASPITGASIGVTCPEVTGTIFSVNAAGPLPCRVIAPTGLTTAVRNMETAYTDAAGRTNPTAVNLGAGDIGGLTLAPGLYKWTSKLGISTDVTLAGGRDAVWIMQIAGSFSQASATKVILTGGAQAKNVFWQAAGQGPGKVVVDGALHGDTLVLV